MKFNNQTFERWYGSSVLLSAAKLKLLPIEDALDRMHVDHYGFAAAELGPEGAPAVAPRIEVALNKALAFHEQSDLPEMATTMPTASDPRPPLMSLDNPPPQSQEEQWKRAGETSVQFDERQKRVGRSYAAFASELTSVDANLVLADLTFRGVQAAIEASPEAGRRCLTSLQSAPDYQLRHLHHFALQVAVALIKMGESEAPELLSRVLALSPTIHRVSGASKLPSEALLFWSISILLRSRQSADSASPPGATMETSRAKCWRHHSVVRLMSFMKLSTNFSYLDIRQTVVWRLLWPAIRMGVQRLQR